MTNLEDKTLGYVTSVFPNKIQIEIDDITAFKKNVDEALGDLKIGSYLEISDNGGGKLIAIIESYKIELKEKDSTDDQEEVDKKVEPVYIIDAIPLGTIIEDSFVRGCDTLTIPPKGAKPAMHSDIKLIYENGFKLKERFLFSKLAQDNSIEIPVNGNKFFNKHFAIIGSSGSGKSHTTAKIIQKAVGAKDGTFELNNSHIVIFDIHNEYKTAFPNANLLDISNIVLPYWLLNGEELEELFLDTSDRNNYNQTSVLRRAITENKKKHNPKLTEVTFGTPCKFDIKEISNCLYNIHNETTDYTNNLIVKLATKDLVCSDINNKYKEFFWLIRNLVVLKKISYNDNC